MLFANQLYLQTQVIFRDGSEWSPSCLRHESDHRGKARLCTNQLWHWQVYKPSEHPTSTMHGKIYCEAVSTSNDLARYEAQFSVPTLSFLAAQYVHDRNEFSQSKILTADTTECVTVRQTGGLE